MLPLHIVVLPLAESVGIGKGLTVTADAGDDCPNTLIIALTDPAESEVLVTNDACVADIQVTPVAVYSVPVGPYVIDVMSAAWRPKLSPDKVSVVAVLELITAGEMAVITGADAAINETADAGDDCPKTVTITLYDVLATMLSGWNLITVGDIHCMLEPTAPVPVTPYVTLVISERTEPKLVPVTVITPGEVGDTAAGERLVISGGGAMVVKLTWSP